MVGYLHVFNNLVSGWLRFNCLCEYRIYIINESIRKRQKCGILNTPEILRNKDICTNRKAGVLRCKVASAISYNLFPNYRIDCLLFI